MNQLVRGQWSSRLAFILAASGSAVGLGNLWRFPYIAGENGGGAFVLVFLLCIAVIGIPIFIAELYIGQKGERNVIQSFERVHREKTPWRIAGWLGLVSAVVILSFYSVVGGWILDFEFRALKGEFLAADPEEVRGTLGELFASPGRIIFWHFIFMSLAIGIVIGGVRSGLERWNKILMPSLFGLLSVFLIYAVVALDGFGRSLEFMFSFDPDKLTAGGVLNAVGHAFFTLSLGMGAIVTYGSYLREPGQLVPTTLKVAVLDTLVAMIAGIVIFSVVFTFGEDPASGPALMFEMLPMLLVQLPGAFVISVLFFLLVTFAAITSAVSLLEVIVAYWTEKHDMSRAKTTLFWGALIFVVGILSALSFNLLSEVTFAGRTFFDIFDLLASGYFLPIGGLIISLFFGWVLGREAVENSVGSKGFWSEGLLWSARIIAPLGVFLVVAYKLYQDLFVGG